MIKKCPDPGCETIYHNCTEKDKKCHYCGGSIKMINKETYIKKYSLFFFQYDYQTSEYFRPNKEII
jgi:hypothetical protein